MDDLQTRLATLFLEELDDNLRYLSEGVATLQQVAPDGADAGMVRQLFRAAHSLKGAAHAAGVTSAVGPCHRLEERLAALRAGERLVDDPLVASLLEDVDALTAVAQTLRTTTRGAPVAPAAPDGADGDRAPQPTAPPPRPASGEARARVAVARLDQLVTHAGALVAATEQVGLLATDLTAASDASAATERRRRRVRRGEGAVDGGAAVTDTLVDLSLRTTVLNRELRRLVAAVADTAQQLRLQSFSDVVAGLDRSVRELCRATRTEARLVVTGGDVELDRDIGDALRDPLLHLLRNAIDHGIESPADRSAVGKPPTGTVRMAAAGDATRIAITVTDDGAGLDLVGLRESGGRLGNPLPDDDTELAFLPGLSTATTVTAVSGRGVGLDAVRARVESLGGTVHIRSDPGHGTEVEVHVPRTLAVLRVVVAHAGGQVVAVPAANLGRLHHLRDEEVAYLEGRLTVAIGGVHVPAVALAGAARSATAPAGSSQLGIAMEILDEDGMLIVDDVETELDVVVQPLPSRLSGVAGVLGAALLPSGRTALVLNPSAALRAGLATTAPPVHPPAPTAPRTVLLAEDTLTTRALERSVLESAGYDVIVAADGAEAWQLLDTHPVDVVVSDVDMPHLDGIELCRAIRSSSRLADVPVVLVTSLSRDEDRQRGVDAGANAYIVKSAFEQEILLDAIRRLV